MVLMNKKKKKGKEEDDEIILQIIYAIYQFLLHESTRTVLLNQTRKYIYIYIEREREKKNYYFKIFT